MANLFFVHTPIQMVIAQQLIHQERLQHNILLYGFIDNNKQFLDIFKLLKIEDVWEKSIYFEHLPACVDLTLRRPFSCFSSILKNTKRLDKIILQYQVDNVYLGDIDNIGYQFLMYYFTGKVKVNIYEEGTSHYTYKNRLPQNRKCQRLQEIILDNCFYQPFYGFNFAKFWYREGDYENLPMDCRYSIIPGKNNESFDKTLVVDYEYQSEQIGEYLAEEISMVNSYKNVSFLITSLIYEHQDKTLFNERYAAYLKAIDGYAASLPANSMVIIKLHPREGKNVASDIKKIMNNRTLNTYFLSKKINIPVELYLQVLHPSEITVFCNSTSTYNGYLYPKCELHDLIYDFFRICDERNYKVSDLKKLYKGLI